MKRLLLLLALCCIVGSEGRAQHIVHDVDLRGDARALFEGVARSYGLKCQFDADYNPGKSIRFQITKADYRTALHLLEAATHSFVVPLSAGEFLVVNDTPEKRNVSEPYVAMTVDVPEALTPQEMTEAVTAVQQALAIPKLGLQTQGNRAVLRGPISKIVPARQMFDALVHTRPQVFIEMEVLEVNRVDAVSYGLDLPTLFSIVHIKSASDVATSLAALVHGGLSGSAFGIALAGANLLAQMEKSSAHSLLHFEARASDRQAVNFHSGDRYPIVTSQYIGPDISNPANPSDPNNPNPQPAPAVFGNVAHPSGLAVADFDKDGVPDIAASSAGGDAAAVMLGKGDGSFRDAVLYAAGKTPSAIAAADLDSDGSIDLITADSESNTVSVLYGNGDGTFKDAVHFNVGTHPAALAIADLNRDGFLDIATANTGSNDVSILLGNSGKTFDAMQPALAGSAPHALIALDLNGDGRPDLVTVNTDSNDASILFGTGDGAFRTPVSLATGRAPVAIAAEDLNHDGRVDLVIANSADNTVSVFVGDGTGQFAAGVPFPAGTNPAAIAIADHNRDGANDVVAACPDGGTISLLLGLGNGNFQAPIFFHTGAQPDAIAVSDLNGDGIIDIVAANSASDNFSLLLGTAGGSFHDPSGQDFPPSGGQTYAPVPSFNYEDLGLVVKATPHVHAREDITLDLEASFKLISAMAASGMPVISNRTLKTEVRVPAGQWAVIAGLLSTSEAHSLSGLPLLPVAGKKQTNKGASQILILIKTSLLSLPPDELVTSAIPLGSETSPRVPF